MGNSFLWGRKIGSDKRDALAVPSDSTLATLEPYLPSKDLITPASPLAQAESHNNSLYPFTTLTFATSLDSALSLSPGTQTILSGGSSKALTHYLRSRHDAIFVGVGTVIADNPSLNCRCSNVSGYGGQGNSLNSQPRPVVVDPTLRWDIERDNGKPWKIVELVREGRGRAPWIVTAMREEDIPTVKREFLESLGGKFISVGEKDRFR